MIAAKILGYSMNTAQESELKEITDLLIEQKPLVYSYANAMLKLDLSFWWYYVLGGLTIAVTYLDVLLPAAGVVLPWSGAVCYFGSFILGGICQVLLHWWRKNQVEVTYAHAYEILNQPREEKPAIVEAGNMLWRS